LGKLLMNRPFQPSDSSHSTQHSRRPADHAGQAELLVVVQIAR
jgi:hypothetical protein